MKLIVTGLFTYPIKGMSGISLEEAELTNTGIAFDRKFMLTNEDGLFLSQRSHPVLSQFKTNIEDGQLLIEKSGDHIQINPAHDFNDEQAHSIKIFQHQMSAFRASDKINNWFSTALGQQVYLVRKAEKRFVENHPTTEINFSDSSQYLIVGESSLDFLNSKLETPIKMNRFRPNIVFSNTIPHEEDSFGTIQIGKANFEFVKQCGRCKVTTIDQETGEMGFEPLATFAGYRKTERGILFGAYLKWTGGEALISLGANITKDSI